MLLGIRFHEENVVERGKGFIVLRMDNPHTATPLWLCSVAGSTEEDYDKNDAMKGAHLSVGERGAIRLTHYGRRR